MAQDSKKYRNSELQIDEVSTTSEKLSGRAGLALFVAYLHSIEILQKLTGFSVPYERIKRVLRFVSFSNRYCVSW